jgi:hypothetical protein
MSGVAGFVLMVVLLAASAQAARSHGGLSESRVFIETNLKLLKAADVSADRHAILASIMKVAADAGKAYLATQRPQELGSRRSVQQVEGSVVPVGDESAMPETSTMSLGRRFLSEGSALPIGDDSAMPEGSVQAVRRSALEEQEAVDTTLLHEKDGGVHDEIKTVVRQLDKLRRNLAADE